MCIDASLRGERRPAEIADGEALDRQPLLVELQVHIGALGLDAGDGGASELERERALARPFEGGVRKNALRQRIGAIEIDVGRAERIRGGGAEPASISRRQTAL